MAPEKECPPLSRGQAIKRIAFLFLVWGLAWGPLQAQSSKPNLILIMADDLGYSELGSYGQKMIQTPHLDQLAKEGMRFTRNYAGNAVCAPSRCVLMTGKHPGHAWVRNNSEVKPEGQRPIPKSEVTIVEILHLFGYVIRALGKWGLGNLGSVSVPNIQGFVRSFG